MNAQLAYYVSLVYELFLFLSVGITCYLFGYYFQKIDTDYYKKKYEIENKNYKNLDKLYDDLLSATKDLLKEKNRYIDYIYEYYVVPAHSRTNVHDINERRKAMKLVVDNSKIEENEEKDENPIETQ